METMKSALDAYQTVQVDAAVLGASPHELVGKLFSKAIESVEMARAAAIEGSVDAKSQHIKIAISIISDGLHSSLNMEAGGELAENLDALYTYMVQRLMKAHIDNDPRIFDEVAALLGEIKSGWDGIKDQS